MVSIFRLSYENFGLCARHEPPTGTAFMPGGGGGWVVIMLAIVEPPTGTAFMPGGGGGWVVIMLAIVGRARV
jgi:hypothetical protein